MTRVVAAVVSFLLLGAAARAAEPPEQLAVPPRPLDGAKLPPGTVVIVNTNPRDALDRADAVVLSPEEYRRLLDEAEQAKRQNGRTEVPSKCRVSARVEKRGQQELVRVQVTFEFSTAAPKTTIVLGCRKAGAVGATMDNGQLPPLAAGDGGYQLVVEQPGPHRIVLDLEVGLESRGAKGGERGFALQLPGSPITLIEKVELPAGVTAARLGRVLPAGPPAGPAPAPQAFTADALRAPPAGQPVVALGPVEGVELYWDVPAAQKPASPLTVALSDVVVRVEESAVTTTARVTLRSLTGRVTEWKLQAPAGAEVAVDSAAALDWDVTPADDRTAWTIAARGPGADLLRVEVTQRAVRKGGPVPVGPIVLAGAFHQQGVVHVRAATHLRPRVSQPRPDVTRAEPDSDGELAFKYGGPGAAGGTTPWLAVDAEPMRGEVRTQVTHQLTLTDAGWRLTADIRATPIRTDFDRLDVDIPAAVQDVRAAPPELVESIVPRRDLGPTRWQIRLAQPRKSEVQIRLEGFYPLAAGTREASLPLPRVAQTFDRDGRVTVAVPERLEVHGRVREWERDRVAEWGQPLEPVAGSAVTKAYTSPRTPAQVDLTWAPVRSELAIDAVVDLTVDEASAAVRHRLTLPPSATPRQLVLRSATRPAAVRTDVGRVAPQDEQWLLTLPASPGKEQTAVLNYVVPVAAVEQRVEVGLLWPEGATRCETRLRVWGRPAAGKRPARVEGPWEDLPTEAVADRPSLPALVLHGSGTDLPLAVVLADAVGLAPGGRAAGLVAKRVLLVAGVADSGHQEYAARFLFDRGAATEVEFDLPAPPAAIDLRVTLGRKLVEQVAVFDDAGHPADAAGGRVVRVPLHGLAEPTFELTLEYRLPASRRAGTAAAGWGWTFAPPRPRGPVPVRAARWYVELPGDGVVLNWDIDATLEQKWGRRRLLPALVPAKSGADLEAWFRAGVRDEDAASDLLTEAVGPEGIAVARAPDLKPLRLSQVPRPAWVLGCSLLALLAGVGLNALWRVPAAFWPGLALVPLALGAAALSWPQPVAAALAATPPGLLVLAAVLTAQWWLRRRYRRRVVFMPGFTRVPQAPSSRSHVGSGQRRRDPSTVDAPAE